MAKTPNYNWTTYEDGVTVINFQTDISNFIKDVDTRLKQAETNIGLLDPEQFIFPSAAGFVLSSSRMLKVGKIVTWFGFVTISTPVSGVVELFTLPEHFRPLLRAFSVSSNADGASRGRFDILPDGIVRFESFTTTYSGWIEVNFTWVTD